MGSFRCAPQTYTTAEAINDFRRVKLDGQSSKTVVYADAGEPDIGTAYDVTLAANGASRASGDRVALMPPTAWTTVKMVASVAIEIHATVYPAADGKVTDIPTGLARGVALEAASADGSVIEVLQFPQEVQLSGPGPGVHGFHEDFAVNSLDGDLFVATASNGGGVTLSDGAGGVVQLGASDSSAVDNDETYMHQVLETFKFAVGKPLVFGARVKPTEANTNTGNFIVGLKDAWAADSILDNGGGPAASYSGAVFFKVDGGTVWQTEASIGTTQTTDTSVGTATTATWFDMRIEFEPGSGLTDGTVRFYLDGNLVHTVTSFDYTSATEMEVGCGVKNGSANEELLDVDFLYCWQAR